MATNRRTHSEDLDAETPDLASSDAAPDTTWGSEDAEDSPRERPIASDDYGTTGAEEARGEPLAARLRREVPDISVRHRPVDPDRRAETGFAGRLVSDDGASVAEGDTGGFAAEEDAVHLEPPRTAGLAPRPSTHGDRLDLLEAEMTVLLTMARVHTEALTELAEALERRPTEEPDEAAAKVSRAAHHAHELLLAVRDVPR